VTPLKDCHAWAILVHQLVTHWAERYGLKELRRWYFEAWNEPNLEASWTGGQADDCELYRHTARAIKRVDERLCVGGPATAQNPWITEFIRPWKIPVWLYSRQGPAVRQARSIPVR